MYRTRWGYETLFPDGWGLDMYGVADRSLLNLAGYEAHYELLVPNRTPLDLPRFGYGVQLIINDDGDPVVVWSKPGGKPYTWHCRKGVAGWSIPTGGIADLLQPIGGQA